VNNNEQLSILLFCHCTHNCKAKNTKLFFHNVWKCNITISATTNTTTWTIYRLHIHKLGQASSQMLEIHVGSWHKKTKCMSTTFRPVTWKIVQSSNLMAMHNQQQNSEFKSADLTKCLITAASYFAKSINLQKTCTVTMSKVKLWGQHIYICLIWPFNARKKENGRTQKVHSQ